jgi:hypothetical protein
MLLLLRLKVVFYEDLREDKQGIKTRESLEHRHVGTEFNMVGFCFGLCIYL